MQNNYCQAEDGGSHGIAIGIGIAIAIAIGIGIGIGTGIGIGIGIAIGIGIGIAIGDRLSRQFDLPGAGGVAVGMKRLAFSCLKFCSYSSYFLTYCLQLFIQLVDYFTMNYKSYFTFHMAIDVY